MAEEKELDYDNASQQELDYGQGNAEVHWAADTANEKGLICDDLPILDTGINMGALTNEQFALKRRQGFGGSDASVLIGANPYTKMYMEVRGRNGMTEPLVVQKSREQLTAEEKAVGDLVAVRKGD